MKLAALEAKFIRWTPTGFHDVEAVGEADGIVFLCPLCFAANNGAAGTHSILVWFAGRSAVPADTRPLPRWSASGAGLADLSLSPSINLDVRDKNGNPQPGCRWHGHVKDGDAS